MALINLVYISGNFWSKWSEQVKKESRKEAKRNKGIKSLKIEA